jgi:hypothetical protein
VIDGSIVPSATIRHTVMWRAKMACPLHSHYMLFRSSCIMSCLPVKPIDHVVQDLIRDAQLSFDSTCFFSTGGLQRDVSSNAGSPVRKHTSYGDIQPDSFSCPVWAVILTLPAVSLGYSSYHDDDKSCCSCSSHSPQCSPRDKSCSNISAVGACSR